jgi:hypothetical protein
MDERAFVVSNCISCCIKIADYSADMVARRVGNDRLSPIRLPLTSSLPMTSLAAIRRLPLFMAYCPDAAGALAKRLEVRPEHLKRWAQDRESGRGCEFHSQPHFLPLPHTLELPSTYAFLYQSFTYSRQMKIGFEADISLWSRVQTFPFRPFAQLRAS